MSGDESFGSPSAAPSEGCEEFWSDDEPDQPQLRRRGGGRLGRPRPTPAAGTVGVWLLTECPELAAASSSADAGILPVESRRSQVEGVAVVHWDYEREEPLPPAPDAAGVRVAGPVYARGVWGLLTYHIDDLYMFEHPQRIDDALDIRSALVAVQLEQLCGSQRLRGVGYDRGRIAG